MNIGHLRLNSSHMSKLTQSHYFKNSQIYKSNSFYRYGGHSIVVPSATKGWLFILFIIYFSLAAWCCIWDLSSPTRGWTCAPCSGSTEPWTLDCWGISALFMCIAFSCSPFSQGCCCILILSIIQSPSGGFLGPLKLVEMSTLTLFSSVQFSRSVVSDSLQYLQPCSCSPEWRELGERLESCCHDPVNTVIVWIRARVAEIKRVNRCVMHFRGGVYVDCQGTTYEK